MGCAQTKPKPKPVANPYAKIYKQVKKGEVADLKPLRLDEITFPDTLKVSADDFELGSYLQEGGVGKVYSAIRKSDGRKVALKLFGYTKRLATPDDIQNEIDLMSALKGIEGIIQTEGFFWDTEKGIVPESKQHDVACPVIVMEMMEGGELFDRMHALKEVSEKYIARIFKSIITALDSMHRKGFVHRDFKLENAMMVSMDKDSEVRIIDFGMVCKIPSYTGCYRGSTIQGTPGYIAPESILYHTYSAKTDLWQAGCTLYSLLSGMLPFNRDDYEQVTHQSFYPMKGVGWENISAEAKDLVRKILTRRPERRIDAEGILKHPWIVSEAPDVNLGDDYFARIKQLALRQKLKCFFLDTRLEERNKLRRNQLQLLIPFLSSSYNNIGIGKGTGDVSRGVPSTANRVGSLLYENSNHSSSSSLNEDGEQMQSKLKNLKDIIIPSLASSYGRKDSSSSSDFTKDMTPEQKLLARRITNREEVEEEGQQAKLLQIDNDASDVFDKSIGEETMKPTPPLLRKISSTSSAHRIDYPTFEKMMEDCGLPELATPSVFKIFDIDHSGYIDLKDFLLTMIAFRDDPEEPVREKERISFEKRSQSFSPSDIPVIEKRSLRRKDSIAISEESAKLYFNVFDYKETGFIDKEELRTVVACILHDQAESDLENNLGGMNFNVEDLFDIIDVKKNGRIDYEEFKQFYEAVLTNTNTRRSIKLDEDFNPIKLPSADRNSSSSSLSSALRRASSSAATT